MRKEIEDLLSEYDMTNSAFAKDLRKALAEQPAQPQQEPVAWAIIGDGEWGEYTYGMHFENSAAPNHKYWEVRGYELQPLYTAPQPAQQEPSEANELLRKLGLDPEQYRTDGGVINHMKLRAAIQHPDEYQAAVQPMYQRLTNCVACGRLNPTEGICNHGAEQPAQQEPYCYTYTENGEEYFAPPTAYVPDNATPLYTSPQPAQQTCNCRWEGDAQVQQCTLHEAHVDAIHEWAERAKTAEAKLKAQPAQQPLTDEQLSDLMPTPQQTGKPAIYSAFDLLWAMRATERAHGIGEKK